jgi:hypothetical protein
LVANLGWIVRICGTLVQGDECPMNFVPFRALFLGNFREIPKGEVRRNPLPRTPLNKGKEEGRDFGRAPVLLSIEPPTT